MAFVWVLLAIVVLGGVAVVAAGRGQGLTPATPDRPDLALPADRPVGRSDVDQVRFSVGLRGYRMDEVDDVLDRLALDLEARDVRISVLEQEVAARSVPATPVAPAPAAAPAKDEPVKPAAADKPAAAGEAAQDEGPDDADQDMPVGRTMIVPFQQTDGRFEHPAASSDSPDDDPSRDGA